MSLFFFHTHPFSIYSSDDEDQQDKVDKKQSLSSPHSKTLKESGTEEDEFEQEMDKEADLLLTRLINRSKTHQNSSSSSRGLEENPPPVTDDRELEKNHPKKEKKKVEYYDDIYFDDTSSEDERFGSRYVSIGLMNL